LEKDANAKVFLEDKDCITTWLVSSVKFLHEHADLARKIVAANAELTEWTKSHPAEAQRMLVSELKAETRTDLSPDTVVRSLKRIQLTTQVSPELVTKAVKDGQETGFIKGSGDTSRLLQKP
jgi:NitT/TauT family transport system substrate-binding protein